MAAILLDEGLTPTVARKWNQTVGFAIGSIRLYTAVSPALSKTSVKASFTEMTAIMGYLSKTVGSADFAYALDSVNHFVIASASYTWVFTSGSGVTILGWYATDSTNLKAYIAEQFASPVVIPALGGSLQLNINDKFQDCV